MIAPKDEWAHLILCAHIGNINPNAVLLPGVGTEPRIGGQEPSGMLRLELEDEPTDSVLLATTGENPLMDPEAGFAETFSLDGVRQRAAHPS